MDRIPLILSAICLLIGFFATVAALKSGQYRPRGVNLGMMALSFLFQTVFLALRGKAMGHCPVTNLFDVLVFLSWSMAIFYFLIGPAYRLSLLGMFTEPLVFLLQIIALLAPVDTLNHPSLPNTRWLELHAALSVMAYGAFAMAGVAGVMYLAQERQLKTRHLSRMFFQMPPITALATANLRLLWCGFGLFTIGNFCGAAIHLAVAPKVRIWGGLMWICYLLILLLARRMGPRRIAAFSVTLFAASVVALFAVGHFNPKPEAAALKVKQEASR